MKNLKKIKLNINYDFSFLLKPLMLLSFLSAVIYGLKLLGISEGDKIFFVLMILVLVPVTLNQIKTVNYKISLIMVLFVFVILYIFIYDDLLLFLAEKSRNNGVIFGVINSIFNTFGLSEFENMIAKNKNAVIIDVRDAKDYEKSHIENSINIPIDDFESRFNELEEYKGKDILIYCSIGRRSAKAAGILENNGYTNVYNAVDGVTEYDFKLVK